MWYDAFTDTLNAALEAVKTHLPALTGATLLVLLGWVLAHLARRWARRLSERFLGRLGATGSAPVRAEERSGLRANTPAVVAGFVFWLVLLGFVAAAAEVLGLPMVTDLLARVADYAPNLLAAILIALGGMIAARFVRAAALRAAEAGGIEQAPGIAAVAEGIAIVLVGVIALEQLGVNARALELTAAITVGSALAAVALAFGLGARSSVANLIGSQYAARLFRVGQDLRIGDIRGTVIELTRTAVVLETSEGRVVVPAQRFHDTIAVIVHKEG